jgi:hypothetical protein
MSRSSSSHSQAETDAVLLARLRAQIEFYFSPQNLSKDTYLRSLLVAVDDDGVNGKVHISIIAAFPKVRELCANHGRGPLAPQDAADERLPAQPALLQKALDGSQVVEISKDLNWIRPMHQLPPLLRNSMMMKNPMPAFPQSVGPVVLESQAHQSPPSSPATTSTASSGVPTYPLSLKERTTIIVRNVSRGCRVDKVLAAFTTGSIQPKSARPDIGDTWYVVFASEADAVAAVFECRDKEIDGIPIQARVKSEAPGQAGLSFHEPKVSTTKVGESSQPMPYFNPPLQYYQAQPPQMAGLTPIHGRFLSGPSGPVAMPHHLSYPHPQYPFPNGQSQISGGHPPYRQNHVPQYGHGMYSAPYGTPQFHTQHPQYPPHVSHPLNVYVDRQERGEVGNYGNQKLNGKRGTTAQRKANASQKQLLQNKELKDKDNSKAKYSRAGDGAKKSNSVADNRHSTKAQTDDTDQVLYGDAQGSRLKNQKKKKNKKRENGTSHPRVDRKIDSSTSNFPALSSSRPGPAKTGTFTQKPDDSKLVGYADALRKQTNPAIGLNAPTDVMA